MTGESEAEKAAERTFPQFPSADTRTTLKRRIGDQTNAQRFAIIQGGKFSITIEEAQLGFILRELQKL